MKPNARTTLTLSTGEAFAVLDYEEVGLGSLRLTLDRMPVIRQGRRDEIMMLAEGANREPVRLLERPAGTEPVVMVRRIY